MDAGSKPPRRRGFHAWDGCTAGAWWRALIRNRGRIGWRKSYVALFITLVSPLNTLLWAVQELVYGRRIRRTALVAPPIFIVGHWRTGTTLLHELLVLDERHTAPTTFECFEPNHFLITEGAWTKLFRFAVPAVRPMDNMRAGFERPQEDEFALCMMGQPSTIWTLAFPNTDRSWRDALDHDRWPQAARTRWQAALGRFLQAVTVARPRRLVLKSPAHTCRLDTLTAMYPDALFVHIVRDPFVVFSSTIRMWQALTRHQGLQQPAFAGLEDRVFETYVRMHRKFEATKHLARTLHELRYEDLVRDPIGAMRRLYERLGLVGFDEVRPRLERYVADAQAYRTNEYNLTPAQRTEVGVRWREIIDRQGYSA